MKRATLSILVLTSAVVVAADAPSVPYPTGFRDWHHVKSMTLNAGHSLYSIFPGIHHIYANKKAVEGYKKGKFSDGSVIIFDLLEIVNADNAVAEGPRVLTGVMHKDSNKYAATGGWGYQAFKGDSQSERLVGADALTACHQCHSSQQSRDFVFSGLRK